jgi:hypothetical protein
MGANDILDAARRDQTWLLVDPAEIWLKARNCEVVPDLHCTG